MDQLMLVYAETLGVVNSLKGFNETPAALAADIEQLNKEYSDVQMSICQLEDRLKTLRLQCDERLNKVYCDRLLELVTSYHLTNLTIFITLTLDIVPCN